MKILNRSGPFICDKCGSSFPTRTSFLSHISFHHGPISFCDLCPRSFVRKTLLSVHMKKDHLKLRPFECHVCSHESSSRGNLKIHMLLHGPKTECQICHKLVSNIKIHLTNHVKVQCSVCCKFCSKASIIYHMKTHRNRK